MHYGGGFYFLLSLVFKTLSSFLHPSLLDDLLSIERIYNHGVTEAVFLWGRGGVTELRKNKDLNSNSTSIILEMLCEQKKPVGDTWRY